MRNNNWKGFFNESLINFQKVIDFSSDPEGAFYNENYAAVGLIMREYMFSVVTDVWGAIPYTFALEGSKGNLAPTYDDQATIYASILANL
ncbi:MAG: SusD/RagB family nutrient-binding outer membrane lipoprotein, partial [Bacteroidota bacterium]